MADRHPVADRSRESHAETDALRLERLLEDTQRLMAERDLDALLDHVCTVARRMTAAGIAGVVLVSEEGRPERLVSPGLDPALAGAMLDLIRTSPEHPARAVVERRAAVSGVNPDGRPERLCLPPLHPPVHSYLFVPVASPARVHGWLTLLEKPDGAGFSDADAQLATTFGALVGMAYENLRLMKQFEAQADELRRREEHVDFALSAARAGVSYRDVDSPWVEISRSIAALFGFPPGTRRVHQRDLYRNIHPDDAPIVRAAVEKAIQDRSEIVCEYRLLAPGASPRWLQFRGRVTVNDRGEAGRIFGVVADVTERRLLEAQLRQAQKMEALGQLAGGVAHDFNNLLTAIIGYGRFALDSAGDPAQRRDIEEIVKAAGRAASLTKQLLAFSRRHVVESAVVDLNLLIVDMVSMLRRLIGEDIELVTSLAPGLPQVRADRGQLEQVVMNLVINARDASGPGGRIRLVTAAIDVDGARASRVQGLSTGAHVTLSVVDNGSGMDDDTKTRLFEPFFTTKPRGQGTGLGLATVYGIVVQSGGAIDVQSEPGHGSSFTIYLPQVLERTASAGRVTDGTPAVRTSTVLLVEDEQAVRELVRIILERAGYHVVEAATPEDAVVLFESIEAVDLLLTDVVMPGMSGFDLYHALVVRLPTLRVLFISGYTDYAMFDPTIAERGAAFLEKPFSAEGLLAKVRDVVGH